MAGKEIAVKKYVVRLSAEEREKLSEFVSSGKRSAQLLTKARILLMADVSETGEGWSDSQIAAALETSIANVERTRWRSIRGRMIRSVPSCASTRRRSRWPPRRARLMVFKLVMAASTSWRRLQGQNQLPKVVSGVTLRDGIEVASEERFGA